MTERRNSPILIALCALFFGVVLGFLLAPMKNGVRVTVQSNNRGIDPTCWDEDGCDDWDEDMEELDEIPF